MPLNKLHVRKNDIVVARKGRDAGASKTGKVLAVFPDKGKALAEGLNMVTKHLRKSQEHPKGMILKRESPMPLANLMLFCPQCKKGVRSLRINNEKGKRIRKCRKCGHLFD